MVFKFNIYIRVIFDKVYNKYKKYKVIKTISKRRQ